MTSSLGRRLFRYKLKLITMTSWDESRDNGIVSNVYKLQQTGVPKGARELYDLLLCMYPCRKNIDTGGLDFAVREFERYVESVTEEEFVFGVKWALVKDVLGNSQSLTGTILVSYLLCDLYGDGTVLFNNDGELIRGDYFYLEEKRGMSCLDLTLMVACNPNVKIKGPQGEPIRIFSPTTAEKIISLLTKKYGLSLRDEFNAVLKSEPEKQIQFLKQLAPLVNSTPVINFGVLFVPTRPPECLQTSSINWERSMVSDRVEDTINLLHNFLHFVPEDLLMHRKFYVRSKGVKVVLPDSSVDNIESLTMWEFHKEGLHYISVLAEIDGVARCFVLPIESSTTMTSLLLYEVDYVAAILCLYVLGLFPHYREYLQSAEFSVPDGVDAKKLAEAILGVLDHFERTFSNIEFRFEEPYWWNERDCSEERGEYRNGTVVDFKEVCIGRYVRALPTGHRASIDAMRLAERCRIKLKPGFTLVDEFVRMTPKKSSRREESGETNVFD